MSRRGIVQLYCLLAGACDAITGLLLVTAPLATLGLMGIAVVPSEPIYLRFIGTFVGAVGLSYLVPFVLDAGARQRRLVGVLEVTAVVRLAVALFIAAAVAGGALVTPWLTVCATDAAFAAVQLTFLARGWVKA